jgi:hypothetical protein
MTKGNDQLREKQSPAEKDGRFLFRQKISSLPFAPQVASYPALVSGRSVGW